MKSKFLCVVSLIIIGICMSTGALWADSKLPDLVVCRPELAEAVLAVTAG